MFSSSEDSKSRDIFYNKDENVKGEEKILCVATDFLDLIQEEDIGLFITLVPKVLFIITYLIRWPNNFGDSNRILIN